MGEQNNQSGAGTNAGNTGDNAGQNNATGGATAPTAEELKTQLEKANAELVAEKNRAKGGDSKISELQKQIDQLKKETQKGLSAEEQLKKFQDEQAEKDRKYAFKDAFGEQSAEILTALSESSSEQRAIKLKTIMDSHAEKYAQKKVDEFKATLANQAGAGTNPTGGSNAQSADAVLEATLKSQGLL